MMRRILLISGTDPSGGAGIAADLATVTARHLRAMPVITAVVAQNTAAVSDALVMPATLVKQQLTAALEEYRPDAVKIGLVPNLELATAIAEILSKYRLPCVVWDPVLISSSGTPLVNLLHMTAMLEQLALVATLITPNLSEASLMANRTFAETLPQSQMREMAGKLAHTHSVSILLKGGHLRGNRLYDLLVSPGTSPIWFCGTRICLSAGAARGTGCRLSSAIAAYLAQGIPLAAAVFHARLALRHHLLTAS